MPSADTLLLTAAFVGVLWGLATLLSPRVRPRHYWLDPEPPLTQRQCPQCERAIFYAKSTDGNILVLDASVPIYVQVQSDDHHTRVCPVAAYIEHSALCHPAPPHHLSTNGRTHHDT
jgi:hypothetical protein